MYAIERTNDSDYSSSCSSCRRRCRSSNSSKSFAILAIVTIVGWFAAVSEAADPNYAVSLRVVDGRIENEYRLVSLSWQDYFNAYDELDVYYTVQSLPLTMQVKSAQRLLRFNDPATRKLSAYNEMRRIVGRVFERVLADYATMLMDLRKPIRVHRNSVDVTGVPVNNRRNTLNRTVVISFEDPPYGQSRVNRLVTDRNIPWTVWIDASVNMIKFNRLYNMTEDLMYRYYHNVGHTLGFGHYVGSNDAASGELLGPSFQRKSVMFASYLDARHSTPVPIRNGVDARTMRRIAREWDGLIEQNVKRFNERELAPAFQTMLVAAARTNAM